MARRYFGTDGIRGKVGEGPITPEFVLRLGYAAGKVLAGADRWAKTRRTAHGADRQRHAGVGLHARSRARVGFFRGGRRRDAGRPDADAGHRLSDARAAARRGRRDQRVAQPVLRQRHQVLLRRRQQAARRSRNRRSKSRLDLPLACAASEQLGKARRLDDAAGRYIEFCKSTFPAAFDLRGLKLVVDCAHGAAYDVAPHVFHELGADVIPIGVAPNGFNINDGVGATAPDALVRAVRANHARPRHRARRRRRPAADRGRGRPPV